MTMQTNDLYLYDNEIFDLIGSGVNFNFNITDLGLRPVTAITTCLKGYVATYAMEKGIFMLKNLIVAHEREFPIINGVFPKNYVDEFLDGIKSKEHEDLENLIWDEKDDIVNLDKMEDNWEIITTEIKEKIYKNLNLKIEYTGSILLGKDAIYKDNELEDFFYLYAYDYRQVYEFILDKGNIVNVINRSKEIKRVREQVKESNFSEEKLGLEKLIEKEFKLDYEIITYSNEGGMW